MAYTTTEEATTTNSTIAPTSTTTTKPDENANGKGHRYVGNYEFFKTLGEGSFAKVKLAAHRLTGEKVAIKIIDKDHLPDAYSLRHVHREARIMRMLDHPNVVQLFEVMETKREVMLVVEYAGGGEVLDYIVAHGRLKEAEARKFIREAVDALEHCHNLNVVHRDLKAENLLLDEDLHVKISVYSAPELIEGKRYVGPEVDAWSLGVNLYAMVVGDLPFADSNLAALYDAILKGKYEMPSFLSPECQDLISKLLVVNPKKRYTCSQVRQHPWFTRQDPERKPEPGSAPSLSFPRRPHNESEIDQIVLDRIEAMGFDRRLVVVSVLEGRFDSAAGTYFSLARKKARDVEAFEKEAGTKTSGRATIAATGATHSRRASIDTTSEELAKLLISVERTRIADTRKSPDDNLSNVPAKQKRTARRGREREDSVGKGSNMSIKDIGGGEADLPTQTFVGQKTQ
ncbi:MAP microtubule affinity-regulating kinase 1 [Borealophlyctis nickersoniae]|nr:MAP microtubule affinity-regulating kinase 1 [Borealophlyctis nickersoniae]